MSDGTGKLPTRFSPSSVTPDLLASLVEAQTKDVEFKVQQLEFDKQKDKHALEFAKESLAATVSDRRDVRDCTRRTHRERYLFFFGVAVVVCVLFGYALHLGKDAFAQEALKDIFLLASGAAGGYGVGVHKRRKSTPPSESANEEDS